jgi:hypothetical protein
MIDSPTQASRFGSRLEQIRDASRRRRAASAAQRTEAEILKTQRMVRGFEYLEQVEAVIRSVLADLVTELPSPPVLSRSFFDGRYLFAARLEETLLDRDGRRDRYFTRLSFLLEPRSDERRFAVEAQATVRNRDLVSERFKVEMTDDGLAELKGFIEGRVLEFAEAYFADTDLSRASEEPSESDPSVSV